MGQVKSRQEKSKSNLNLRTAHVDKCPNTADIPNAKDNLTPKEDSVSAMATKETDSAATHVDDTNTQAHEGISMTGGQESTTNRACAIDMLTDDALLSIFSYLVLLCDRGQVARLVLARKSITAGIETNPVNKSLSIPANTALSRDFRLRHIASVICCPYIMLRDHDPGPLHIV